MLVKVVSLLHRLVSGASVCWSPPVVGQLKCNIEASVVQSRSEVGLGMIVCDWRGVVIAARTATLFGCFSPLLAEAMCLKEAFSWLQSRNYANVLIDYDAKLVVDAFN